MMQAKSLTLVHNFHENYNEHCLLSMKRVQLYVQRVHLKIVLITGVIEEKA